MSANGKQQMLALTGWGLIIMSKGECRRHKKNVDTRKCFDCCNLYIHVYINRECIYVQYSVNWEIGLEPNEPHCLKSYMDSEAADGPAHPCHMIGELHSSAYVK